MMIFSLYTHPYVSICECSVSWDLVEKITGLKVDTVILDCEGCWIDVVKENLEKFRNVNKVILGKFGF